MSKFTLKRSKGGFTLIEIMIVVLIIGILLAIAIPNFMSARETSRTKSCIANLKQIETAKAQLSMKDPTITTPTMADLVGADKYIKTEPFCPSGSETTGKYTNLGATMDDNPVCPINPTDHKLPAIAAAAAG